MISKYSDLKCIVNTRTGAHIIKPSVLPGGTCGKRFPCNSVLLKRKVYTEKETLLIAERLKSWIVPA